MKILIVTNEYVVKDERYMDDKGWSFGKAFERLGIKTETFFYKSKGRLSFLEKDKRLKLLWRAHMNKQLFEHVKRSKPDVMLIIKGDTVEPETLWKIRKKTGALLLNVFTDNPLLMGKFEAIEPCNYFFVKDSYILGVLRKAGLTNVHYLPQCTNPEVLRSVELNEEAAEYASDLTLIGSMYPYRHKFIEQLLEFSPSLWGRGWSRSPNSDIRKFYRGKDIRGTQKAKAISGAAISLNLHHPLNDINGTNSRTFDIAACKGFQLADYKSDLEDLLKVGEEIICFRTLEELKNLLRYYLIHPEEKAQIAEAAHKRVLREHTYDARAKEMLDIIRARY